MSVDEEDPSALELSRSCPVCRGSALRPTSAPLAFDACPSCFGGFFDSGARRALLEHVGAASDALTPGSEPGEARCGECRGGTFVARLGGERVEVCERCSGVWVPAGSLYGLTRGAAGLPSGPRARSSRSGLAPIPRGKGRSLPPTPSAPPPERASSRRRETPDRPSRGGPPILAVTLVVVALAAGVGAALQLRRGAELEAARAEAAAKAALAPPALPPPERVLGGRSVAWWTTRLNRLSQDPGAAERYALMQRRAAAHGLSVEGTPGALRLVPKDGPR